MSDENIKLKNELKKFKGELHKSDEAEPAVVSEDASAVKVTYIDMIEKEKEINQTIQSTHKQYMLLLRLLGW